MYDLIVGVSNVVLIDTLLSCEIVVEPSSNKRLGIGLS